MHGISVAGTTAFVVQGLNRLQSILLADLTGSISSLAAFNSSIPCLDSR
jgi:hypothetical protein